MIEIKDLKKTYTTKDNQVVALHHINLQLPNVGFVILLGKSGCGKSTLLNIIGGLDSFDKGDLIIDGNSLKTFNVKEKDYYRNAFIGFVFQEFNVIEHLLVYKNIALSLELQNKHENDIQQKVKGILDIVGLDGLGKRKPNELSGGQKQRVAIARALIKNPKVILADEPTGNLDQDTGRKILETLKLLSKDRLVIMATHDEDFAYRFGDRIIKLVDGMISSDEINEDKELDQSHFKQVLEFKPGEKVDETTLNKINKIIKDDQEQLYLMIHKKVTKEENKKNVHLNLEVNHDLIKSNLSIKNTFQFAWHNLLTKKIRLFFLMILLITSLILLGIASTFSFYDPIKAQAITMTENQTYIIPFKNKEVCKGHDCKNFSFTNEEIAYLENKLPNIQFMKRVNQSPTMEYTIDKFVILNPNLESINQTQMGSVPQKLNEVMVTSAFIRELIPGELDDQAIIGRTFKYNNRTFTITGVITDDEKGIYTTQETMDQSVLLFIDYNINKQPYIVSKPDLNYDSYLISGSSYPKEFNEIIIPLSRISTEQIGDNIQLSRSTFIITGIIDDVNNEIELPFDFMVSLTKFDQLKLSQDYYGKHIIGEAILRNDHQLPSLLKVLDDLQYKHYTNYSYLLYNFQDFTKQAKNLFYAVGGVFALFASVLLLNYILASIRSRQKDIGILKAMGASSRVISRIYILEGLIIGCVSSIVANLCTSTLIYIYNQSVSRSNHLTLVYINTYSILFVFALTLGILFLAIYIPIKYLTIKNPMQVIRRI